MLSVVQGNHGVPIGISTNGHDARGVLHGARDDCGGRYHALFLAPESDDDDDDVPLLQRPPELVEGGILRTQFRNRFLLRNQLPLLRLSLFLKNFNISYTYW